MPNHKIIAAVVLLAMAGCTTVPAHIESVEDCRTTASILEQSDGQARACSE